MPDFEALIRHQQLKTPAPNKRLKAVGNEISRIHSKQERSFINWKIIYYFLAGFTGGLIGSIILIFLEVNKLIDINFFKII